MISGISPTLSYGYNEPEISLPEKTVPDIEIEPYTHTIPQSEIKVIEGLHSRILLYDSNESLDKAANSLTSAKIKHKYHVIPALSTTKISENEIPQNGLVSAIINSMSIRPAVENDNEIGDIYTTGFDLKTTARFIKVSSLHDLGLTGEGVKIAVLDTGIKGDLDSFNNVEEWSVPELENVTERSRHATHVAGILAGNGIYKIDGKYQQFNSTGMAKNAQIYSLRVLNELGFGEIDWVLQGIQKAIDLNVDIISMSLSSELYTGMADLHEILIAKAINQGITIVSAAGNLGPIGSGIGVPGALEQVISVGAAEIFDNGDIGTYQFSAIGPRVNEYPSPDVLAPGVKILSVDMDTGGARADEGTSMATPHVSGGIALLIEAFPNVTVNQIREALLASADPLSASQPIEKVGRGFVNFELAYNILSQTYDNSTKDSTFAMASAPNAVKDQNLYFRHQIFNKTKTLPFFIHSSRNVSLVPKVETSPLLSRGVEIELPELLIVFEGLNKYFMNITVTLKSTEPVGTVIYFEDNDSGTRLQYANITYSALVRFPQADILFDASKDSDTNSTTYFGGHSNQGQFSYYARSLEQEGHTVDLIRNEEVTAQVLDKYDILIIANPDKEHSSKEIEAIRNFVYKDGKSLLIIAGGGLLMAEEFRYDVFNAETLENILLGSGMGFMHDSEGRAFTATNYCDTLGVIDRYNDCVDSAETTNNQNVLSNLVKFPHYGPPLDIDTSANSNVQAVALADGFPVILASELPSNGRIMLFSSPLLFDNKGQIDGYPSLRDDTQIAKSNDLTHEAMDWLLQPRSIKISYSVNDVSVQKEVNINLHEKLTIRLSITNPTGDLITLKENSLFVNMIQFDPHAPTNKQYNYLVFEFQLVGSSYEIEMSLSRFGTYDFFTLVEDPSGLFISSSGHVMFNAALENFNDQDQIRSIGLYLFFALMGSWAIFIYNEGGRKRFLKKKKEVEKT